MGKEPRQRAGRADDGGSACACRSLEDGGVLQVAGRCLCPVHQGSRQRPMRSWTSGRFRSGLSQGG